MDANDFKKITKDFTNDELIKLAKYSCNKSIKNGHEPISIYSDTKIKKVINKTIIIGIFIIISTSALSYHVPKFISNIITACDQNDKLSNIKNKIEKLMKENYNFYGSVQTKEQYEKGIIIDNFDYNCDVLAQEVLNNIDIIDAYLYEIYTSARPGSKDKTLNSVLNYMNFLNPDGTNYLSLTDYAKIKDITDEDGKIDLEKWRNLSVNEVELSTNKYVYRKKIN